jgi:hypothetical protein
MEKNKMSQRGTGIPSTISLLPRHRNLIIQLVSRENMRRASRNEAPLSISAYIHSIIDATAREEGLAS